MNGRNGAGLWASEALDVSGDAFIFPSASIGFASFCLLASFSPCVSPMWQGGGA